MVLVTFVAWERRSTHPMLDVQVFSNARFSAASISVAFAFFALFGFIFLITQYFQVVRGYDTLSAGVHTLPFAVAVGITSPLSARLALRIGTKAVVAGGLAVMGVGFVVASTNGVDTPYWGPVVLAMVLIAAGLGLATAPATESIMGSLPRREGRGRLGGQRHHPGAGRDARRRRGGLGLLVGLRTRLWRRSWPACPSPAPRWTAAKESVGATLAVAEQAGQGGPRSSKPPGRRSWTASARPRWWRPPWCSPAPSWPCCSCPARARR